ncbi:AbrB family transcriptional regulator [Radiobacillus sp. PE A8.2]|uniref:AbrB family transcriptional regulator n=1 Tax=Radiobacillus sp. PE A8.2 TaxID=3380349 RepID=UPI00388FCB27
MSRTPFNRIIRFIITFVLSLLGGTLFYFLHVPLPWLLGSMVIVLITSTFTKYPLYWPIQIRNTGLIVIGYMLGSSITLVTLIAIIHQLPTMLIVTLFIVISSMCFAFFVSKFTGISLRSAIAGSIPGGLSQMIVLGEEIKDVDVTVVTFFQLTRLFSVIFIVPVIALSPLLENGVGSNITILGESEEVWQWSLLVIYTIATIAAAFIGKIAKLPTAYLLGPMLITAIVGLSGIPSPELPNIIVDVSQLMMGAYIALMIKPAKLENKVKTAVAAIITGLALVCFSFGIGIALEFIHEIPAVTAFLSTAPGGIAEMGIVAKEVNADLPTVTGYQTFRILFILFLVPYTLRWLFRQQWFINMENMKKRSSK